MKKKIYLSIYVILCILVNGCGGYEPIYNSSNAEFKIANHIIEGEKLLGNKIYKNIYRLSNSNKIDKNSTVINILIKVTKTKDSTSKDSSGKILEYKIKLDTEVNVKNFITDKLILDQIFTSTQKYKVQEEYSDTLKLENKSIDDLISKTYQEILYKLSQNILLND